MRVVVLEWKRGGGAGQKSLRKKESYTGFTEKES